MFSKLLMKKRKKPDKFLLPHGMPSDKREFAFSSRVLPKALKIKAPYKSWHYQATSQHSQPWFDKEQKIWRGLWGFKSLDFSSGSKDLAVVTTGMDSDDDKVLI